MIERITTWIRKKTRATCVNCGREIKLTDSIHGNLTAAFCSRKCVKEYERKRFER